MKWGDCSTAPIRVQPLQMMDKKATPAKERIGGHDDHCGYREERKGTGDHDYHCERRREPTITMTVVSGGGDWWSR